MFFVRGKPLTFTKHAYEGMRQERPPLDEYDIALIIEEPDHDDGNEVRKRVGRKIIRAYYEEYEDHIRVRAVSRTTRDIR